MEIPDSKLTPELRWPVFTRKSLAGFARKLTAVGEDVERAILRNGFKVNQDKVYLASNRRRQRVTGIIVNEKINVPRRFVRQLRAMIHAVGKFGEAAASAAHFAEHYRREAKTREPTSIVDVMIGKMNYLKMIKGIDDPVYRNLQRQFVAAYPEYFEIMKKENEARMKRDIFISHASEDKDLVARPLAKELVKLGRSVWFDEYELRIGDSLLEKIDDGLMHSDFGLVVLSPSFFSKRWPRKELDGLTAMEAADGRKRILPIWHKLEHGDVVAKSPVLAGLFALETAKLSVREIAKKIDRDIP